MHFNCGFRGLLLLFLCVPPFGKRQLNYYFSALPHTYLYSHPPTHTHSSSLLLVCVVATEAGPLEATPATCNISGGSSNINPLQQQHSARANLTNQPTIAIANNTTNKNNYNNNVNNNYNNSTNTTTNNTNNAPPPP